MNALEFIQANKARLREQMRNGGRAVASKGAAVVTAIRSISPERVKAFLDAVTGPQASKETFQQRLSICESNTCGRLKKLENGQAFCGACGCPKWKLAELHTKLRFAHLACPKDPPLWGAE